MGERVARASIILSAGSLATLLINSIGSIVVARILGPERYGLIAVSMMLPNLLLAMLDLGLNAAATRYASARRIETLRAVAPMKLFLAALTGLAAYSLAPLFAAAVDKDVVTYVRILSVFTAASFLIAFSQSLLMGLGSYVASSLASVSLSLLKVSLAIYFAPRGLEWVLAAYSLAALSVGVPLATYSLRRIGSPSLSREGALEALSFSIPLHLPTVVGWGTHYLLYGLAARVSSDAELGNYGVALAVMMPVNYTLGSIASALLSVLPSLSEDERRRTILRVMAITSFFAPAASLAVGFGSELIVTLLYGEGYSLSPLYLILLSLTYLLAPLGSLVWSPYFSSIGRSDVVLKASVAQALLGSPLQAALIVTYGLPGHIVGGILSSMVGNLYMLSVARRELGISYAPPLRALTPTALAAIASLPFLLGDYPIVIAPALYAAILLLTSPLLAEEELAGTARAMRSVRLLSPLSELIELEMRAIETVWGVRKERKE